VVLLAGATREALGWERGGGVHLLDWSGLVGPDLGLAAVCWDPLDGCRDTRVASSRVAALQGAVDGSRGRDGNDGFWKEGAGTVLRPYLHAAALVGTAIGQVLHWLDPRSPPIGPRPNPSQRSYDGSKHRPSARAASSVVSAAAAMPATYGAAAARTRSRPPPRSTPEEAAYGMPTT
jgi:hypothetical protein